MPDVGDIVLPPIPHTDGGELDGGGVQIPVAGTHKVRQHAILVVGLAGDEGDSPLEQVHVGMTGDQCVEPDRAHRGGGEEQDVGPLRRLLLHPPRPPRDVIEFAVEPEEPLPPIITAPAAGQVAP